MQNNQSKYFQLANERILEQEENLFSLWVGLAIVTYSEIVTKQIFA